MPHVLSSCATVQPQVPTNLCPSPLGTADHNSTDQGGEADHQKGRGSLQEQNWTETKTVTSRQLGRGLRPWQQLTMWETPNLSVWLGVLMNPSPVILSLSTQSLRKTTNHKRHQQPDPGWPHRYRRQHCVTVLKRTQAEKAPGTDTICGHTLKHCAKQQLGGVLKQLFLSSLATGTVPHVWKHSTIISPQGPEWPQTYSSHLPRHEGLQEDVKSHITNARGVDKAKSFIIETVHKHIGTQTHQLGSCLRTSRQHPTTPHPG